MKINKKIIKTTAVATAIMGLLTACTSAFFITNGSIITARKNTSGSKASEIRIVVDNKEINVPDEKPFIDKNGRTMVPLRVISENLGAKVDWDSSLQKYSVDGPHVITKEDISIYGYINRSTAKVNGATLYLDPNNQEVTAVLKGGRTFVPLRFSGENLGYEVEYKNRVVYITTPGTPVVELPEIEKIDGEVKFTGQKDFAKDVAKYVPGMTSTGSEYNDQSHFGTNGSKIIVAPTSPEAERDIGFSQIIVINGWNIPGRQIPPSGVRENAETMKTTKQIFALYTSEHEKVYSAYDSYVKTNDKSKTVKTEDGRTFQFTYESSGGIIRIK